MNQKLSIDDVEYLRGRNGFAAGGEIRPLIERAFNAQNEEAELRAGSALIGFLDGAFDRMRGITR